MFSTLVVGGVPEHFNLPWHLAREEGLFTQQHIDLKWQDFPGGTGAMCKALRSGEVDAAVLLTEGIIRDIAQGNPSRIIQVYVSTPLVWGAHVGAESKFANADDLKNARYAISRKGSGSHLMAFVHADQRGRETHKLEFNIVGGLEGARASIAAGETDCLLWEKFMTKRYVDSGELRRVDEVDTPWPCFVLAVREQVLEEQAEAIERMMNIMRDRCATFKADEHTPDLVVERYGLKMEDARDWFTVTEWARSTKISKGMLDKVGDTLVSLELLEERPNATDLTAHPASLIL